MGQSVVLIAPRRYGKTSLMLEIIRRNEQQGNFILYTDLFSTPDIYNLAADITRGVLQNRKLKFTVHQLKNQIVDLMKNLQFRQDILSMLIGIKQFDKPQKPTFMCLHFMIPHSPFIFQADGSRPKYFESAFTKFENKVKFVEQVKFAGSQIIEIVDSIRQKDKDAIIIIQADHGFGGDEDMIYLNRNSLAASTNNREKPPSDYLDQRFGILNALSSPLELGIPEHSTPVNLFRYFFNEVFEDSYDYLPNNSYFALIKQPYLFHDVTDDLNQYNNRNSERFVE